MDLNGPERVTALTRALLPSPLQPHRRPCPPLCQHKAAKEG